MLRQSLTVSCITIWAFTVAHSTTLSSLEVSTAALTNDVTSISSQQTTKDGAFTDEVPGTDSATVASNSVTTSQTGVVSSSENHVGDASEATTQTSNSDDEAEAEEERNPSPLPGYSFPLVSEISELDYIYGPIVIGLSFLSTIIIVLAFMRKSMRSPTTIILTGIVVSDTLKSLLRYGNYLYMYFTYGTGTIDIVLPYCIFLFYSQIGENVCYSVAQALWACLAIQRVLVIKFPFKSREILTTKASLLTVSICILLAFLYRLPELYFSGKLTSYRDFLILSGYKPSDFYYYYYYYYYEEGSNETVGYETYVYSTIAGDEDLCMTYQDPAFTKAYEVYHPICSLVPFFVYLISSIYIIYSVVARNDSTDIHESKGRMQKIEMMTRSILIILLVQCIKKTIGLFNLIITFITKMEIYDVWGKMDLDAMRVLYKFREIVSAAASLINFWIIVGACEQFRKEIFSMFTGCSKLKRHSFKNSVKKLGESSTSSSSTKGSTVTAKDKII